MPPFRPFRRLLSGFNQMSYQNTVAVSDKGDMLLGFIQDINGDQVFVNFDSSKVKARWVDAACVYSMPWYDHQENHQRDKPVYAALRDEDDGPFRFQSVFIIFSVAACKRCYMCYVKANVQGGDPAKARIELIDHRQILGLEWFTEPAFLYRNSALGYTKYCASFTTANQLLGQPADRSRVIKHFREVFEEDAALSTLTDCCRFHLRIEANNCVFVVIGVGTSADAQQMTMSKLCIVVERHLATRGKWLPTCSESDPTDISAAMNRIESSGLKSAEAMLFCHLPHWIFSEICSYLDLHSQMKLTRVCALWQQLLSSPGTTKHIRVRLDSMTRETTSDNYNCFTVAALLTRTINPATKSLTIITRSLGNCCTLFLPFLLGAMKAVQVHLPLIVLKDFVRNSRGTCTSEDKFHLTHCLTTDTKAFAYCCDRIVWHNWKVSYLFGRPMYEIFAEKEFKNLWPLPTREKNLMLPLGWDHTLTIDQLEITVPRLVLDCLEGRANMVSRIMWAVNEGFPPVTDAMQAKVNSIYARWVRDLLHPPEWDTIRSYLSVFSGFHADGTPRSWVDVDLTQVDTAQLSKMALYGINEIFMPDQ
ncbi:uncharacterized protein LOC129600489 [Paramacrobiotus metropolitanus]|uniref:uncharacterized protein LOC129600489 n=1 Tax=Paramacrobiotus metropolitanus TaxID=2943436 RepID=UPI0024463C49|nr:uncharacterized protein LOC129600489 [Paramacrobiotus metropolitanus]XP_055355002.1 uncharacterized protein LOC129600489 [Paramacrobiotus metropolitanus]